MVVVVQQQQRVRSPLYSVALKVVAASPKRPLPSLQIFSKNSQVPLLVLSKDPCRLLLLTLLHNRDSGRVLRAYKHPRRLLLLILPKSRLSGRILRAFQKKTSSKGRQIIQTTNKEDQ
jgi:hypothetical protein